MAVVLLSTAYFALAGVENWRWLPMIWAILPFVNAFLYAKVPMTPPLAAHERTPLKALFSRKLFWVFLLMMICAGASEQAMSQWSSLFAERGLAVDEAGFLAAGEDCVTPVQKGILASAMNRSMKPRATSGDG